MAIDSISPSVGARSLVTISRPPETTADARESSSQANDARRVAESLSGASPAYLSGPQNTTIPVSVGTHQTPVPAPSSVESSRESPSMQAAQLAQASPVEQPPQSGQSGPTGQEGSTSRTPPAGMRSAAEAYRAESAARDEETGRQQQQANGSQSLNIMA